MTARFDFDAIFTSTQGSFREPVTVRKAIVGGWTGRDREALQHHVDELAKIGVRPPARMPLFYRVGVSRLSTSEAIEVIGTGSSGEVEYLLFQHKGRTWVGAGSDHTDRAVEAMGITIAKQLCDKPICREFWPLDEVQAHWDDLRIRSSIRENGAECLYQNGSLSGMLSPGELLAELEAADDRLDDGTMMFGGTCGAIGGIRYSARFGFELHDPVLKRRLAHAYEVVSLPIAG